MGMLNIFVGTLLIDAGTRREMRLFYQRSVDAWPGRSVRADKAGFELLNVQMQQSNKVMPMKLRDIEHVT